MIIKMKNILNESIQEKIAIALEYLKHIIDNSQFKNKVFLAGGAVRDTLLNIQPKDIDVVVIGSATAGIDFATWATKYMGNFKDGSNPVIFPKYFTSKFSLEGIIYKDTDLSDVQIEAVAPRKETYIPGSRNPVVKQTDLKGDAERRDLTVNSLFKNITTGEVLDLTGKGLEDLKSGIAKTPLDPDITFSDDPLRMLRVIRQSTKYNWKIPFGILKSIKKNAHLINNISAERVQVELNKILMTNSPQKGIKLLQVLDLNKYILPEFEKIVGMIQNDFHEFSADKHTYEVLKNSKPELIVRISALFHDLGKGSTKTEKNNKIHFYGHEEESEKIVRNVLARLKYPITTIDAVAIAVRNHMRAKSYGPKAELVTDKALRKLMNNLGDHLENTLSVIDADNRSHGDQSKNWPHNLPDQVSYIKKKIKDLGDFTGKLKIPINGTDIINLIKKENPDFKPGPIMTKILDAVKDKFLENPGISKEEAEKIVIDVYRNINLEKI